jgi:hypothetical protein
MLTAVILTGCKDAFRARPEVVAEAAGQELKIEHLGKLLAGIKSVPISKEAADLVINMWVDHTLFAQAIASGRTLQDSATAANVLWPELSEMIGSQWHDTLIASKVKATPEQADSAYNVGDVRLLQHILIRVPPNSEPPAIAAAKKKIEMIQGRVNRGENFEKLAKEFSEDPGSASNGGYYPPSPKGKFVTAFDSAGWSLAPGARTGIIETPFGYHIIRRPAPSEVRPQMIEYVRARVGIQLDSIYLQSLGEKHGLKVDKNAVARMRKAVSERDKAIVSRERLATYDSGELTVSDFMRWVSALGPDWAVKLTSQPDTMLISFVRLIGQNQLLLKQADSAGVRVTDAEWQEMSTAYGSQVDSLRMLLHITESDLGDAAASESDRKRTAALKVASYWDALATGTAERPRPVPAQLGMILRQTEPHKINNNGIAQALELAHALKDKADPASAGGPPGLPPGVPVITAPAQGAPR